MSNAKFNVGDDVSRHYNNLPVLCGTIISIEKPTTPNSEHFYVVSWDDAPNEHGSWRESALWEWNRPQKVHRNAIAASAEPRYDRAVGSILNSTATTSSDKPPVSDNTFIADDMCTLYFVDDPVDPALAVANGTGGGGFNNQPLFLADSATTDPFGSNSTTDTTTTDTFSTTTTFTDTCGTTTTFTDTCDTTTTTDTFGKMSYGELLQAQAQTQQLVALAQQQGHLIAQELRARNIGPADNDCIFLKLII